MTLEIAASPNSVFAVSGVFEPGHKIIQKGKKYVVANFEKYLAKL